MIEPPTSLSMTSSLAKSAGNCLFKTRLIIASIEESPSVWSGIGVKGEYVPDACDVLLIEDLENSKFQFNFSMIWRSLINGF